MERKKNVEHFLFIGGITDKSKTDLVFEYLSKNGVYKNYTPDFLVILKNGEFIFLETKSKMLEEDFKVKEKHFKQYLTDNIKYKLMLSENTDIVQEDKKYITEVLK